MRKVKLYIAVSLNGKIARKNGDVDWLDAIPNPENEDYGYFSFYETIDTTIMGNKTYQQVLGFGVEWPYKDKKNYVFSRCAGHANTEFVDFVSEDHAEFIRGLKAEAGKDIWLVGGGAMNTMFLDEGLIDEIWIHTMPVIIRDGIDLFEDLLKDQLLKLTHLKEYPTGVIEARYTIE